MSRTVRYAFCIVLLVVTLGFTVPTAKAATASVGGFYAGCGLFSVNVTVTGNQDDGGGMDKLRFIVSDGGGNVLYQEDASIKVSTSVTSQAVNLAYSRGAASNPIRFAVQNLNSGGGVTGEVAAATYNATCKPAVGSTTNSGFFRLPAVFGTLLVTTQLYDSPGGAAINNATVAAGKVHFAVYRSLDNAWIGISVGSNDLVWVPTSTIAVNLGQLPFKPTHLFGSSFAAGANGDGSVVNTGTNTRAQLNLRGGPGVSFAVLTRIPRNAPVTVIGRDNAGRWLKLTFNGVTGWAYRSYITITTAAVKALPVVQ